MKKYFRHKTPDEIKQQCLTNWIKIDTMKYDEGGDHLVVYLPGPYEIIPVLYNVVNGRFSDGNYFNSDQDRGDQPWFVDMLDFFYSDTEEFVLKEFYKNKTTRCSVCGSSSIYPCDCKKNMNDHELKIIPSAGPIKIVINICYGGFGLSDEALTAYSLLVGEPIEYELDIGRSDPNLVKVIEELGDKANGRYAKLKIVEIPGDVEWTIEEYDGMEFIHEVHRVWS